VFLLSLESVKGVRNMARKRFIGTVVSDKMDKTRVVVVERRVPHPLYKKVVKRRSKFYVHDENNISHVGDKVLIEESKPISKLKKWVLLSVVERSAAAVARAHLKEKAQQVAETDEKEELVEKEVEEIIEGIKEDDAEKEGGDE